MKVIPKAKGVAIVFNIQYAGYTLSTLSLKLGIFLTCGATAEEESIKRAKVACRVHTV